MLGVLVLVRQRLVYLGQLAGGSSGAKMTISGDAGKAVPATARNSIRGLIKNPSVESWVTTCPREFSFHSEILFGL
jgi:hypothetical protein